MIDEMCSMCTYCLKYGDPGEEKYVCRRYPPSIAYPMVWGQVMTHYVGGTEYTGGPIHLEATDDGGTGPGSLQLRFIPNFEDPQAQYPFVYFSGWCGEYKPA